MASWPVLHNGEANQRIICIAMAPVTGFLFEAILAVMTQSIDSGTNSSSGSGSSSEQRHDDGKHSQTLYIYTCSVDSDAKITSRRIASYRISTPNIRSCQVTVLSTTSIITLESSTHIHVFTINDSSVPRHVTTIVACPLDTINDNKDDLKCEMMPAAGMMTSTPRLVYIKDGTIASTLMTVNYDGSAHLIVAQSGLVTSLKWYEILFFHVSTFLFLLCCV
jgi:hypothetical protein